MPSNPRNPMRKLAPSALAGVGRKLDPEGRKS